MFAELSEGYANTVIFLRKWNLTFASPSIYKLWYTLSNLQMSKAILRCVCEYWAPMPGVRATTLEMLLTCTGQGYISH